MAQLMNEIINAAIEGFEGQKRRIDEQIAELRSMLNGSRARFTTSSNGKGRTISAAGRARIAEAQRKRWAASKGETTSSAPASKPKRKLSAAGRASIVAALKKRWAAKKAGSGTAKGTTATPSKAAKAAKRVARKKSAAKTTSAAVSATA